MRIRTHFQPLTLLVCLAMLASVPLAQADEDSPEVGTSEWRTLAGGYLGRAKIALQSLESVAPKTNTKATRSRSSSSVGWLKTVGEGLFAAPIPDLAAQLGMSESTLRSRATKGTIALENKNQAVPWVYDSVADALVFVAETYDTFYSNQNAYHLTVGGKGTAFIPSSNSQTTSPGVPNPFADTLKFEEEPSYFYATWSVPSERDADYWWWDYLYAGYKNSLSVPLHIPTPDTIGTAQMRITLRGWTDLAVGDEHRVTAKLNGVSIGGQATWDGFDEKVLVADFDQSLLSPDGNNTLSLYTDASSGIHSGQWLDQVEVDYQRMPIADNGRLWLHKVSNGTQLVAGFSSDAIQVFELPRKGGNAIERRDVRIESDTLGGFQVVFDAKGKSDFVIAERSELNVPSMEADIPSDLNNRRNKADYLIIAPREFSNTAELLRDFRKAKFRDATIVWLDDIYDEFSAGRTDPFAIADFLQKAQKKWSLAPSVVVLLGKGTLDHKNRMGFNDSFLPVVMTDTPWLLAASDERLLGGDGLTSVIYGRIPITSDAQGLDYVAKLKNYEMADPVASHTGVLVADNPDDAGDFHTNSDALAKRLSTTLGFASTTKLYHPNDDVRAEFVKSSTWDDAAYINYDGHGSATQLGNGQENFINTSDAAALANGKLPIFTALTCSAGDFANPGVRSLTAAMVLNANGGAISAIAPTGYSIDQDAQALGNALVDNLFHGSTSVGEALKKAKQQSDNQTNDFMPRIYMVVGEPGVTPQPIR